MSAGSRGFAGCRKARRNGRRSWNWQRRNGSLGCGHCGCALSAERKKSPYSYWHCTGDKSNCPEPPVREEVPTAEFQKILAGLQFDEEILQWVRRALQKSHTHMRRFHDEAIVHSDADDNRLQTRLDVPCVERLHLAIMSGWRVVTRLYCTPEYYGYAIQWLRWGAAHARYQEIGTPAPASLVQNPPGSLGLEWMRRLALVAGVCTFLWLAFWTPPVLVKLERADFREEYERKYGERKYPAMGAMEMGREFIRANTNPGSVESYALRTTEHYLLKASGQKWVNVYRSVASQTVFYSSGDAAIAELMPQVESVFKRSTRLSAYLPVPAEGSLAFLEVWYVNRPRESAAGATLVYPKRSSSWIWLVGGLLAYLVLPWPRRGGPSLTNDRTSITIVDLLGTLFAAFFFAIPLHAANFTDEVLGEEIGVTIFCWCLALSGIGVLTWTSRLVTRRQGLAA